MLKLLDEGKIIINVDESSFMSTDQRHRKWALQGTSNSVKQRTVSPNISLLAAVSSLGDVYLAVSQINTDSDSFCLFMKLLISKVAE